MINLVFTRVGEYVLDESRLYLRHISFILLSQYRRRLSNQNVGSFPYSLHTSALCSRDPRVYREFACTGLPGGTIAEPCFADPSTMSSEKPNQTTFSIVDDGEVLFQKCPTPTACFP